MLRSSYVQPNIIYILLHRRQWGGSTIGARTYSSGVTTGRNSSDSFKNSVNGDASGDEMTPEERDARAEAYRQVHNLDFATAAKILFTVPPKRKKFGLDFHLVQLFFALMPSFAVYLVAQYSRYEMRKWKAQEEEKKKREEEERAKEAELLGIEDPDKKLAKVIGRLDALEEAVKEIKEEKGKPSSKNLTEQQVLAKAEGMSIGKSTTASSEVGEQECKIGDAHASLAASASNNTTESPKGVPTAEANRVEKPSEPRK